MVEKKAFFNLDTTTRSGLRLFLGLVASTQIAATVFLSPQGSPFCASIGIGLNLLLLFFAFQIQLAPNILFRLIPWFGLIILIFDGQEVFAAVNDGTLLTPGHMSNVVSVILVLAFSPLVIKYWREVAGIKKPGGASESRPE